MISKKWNKPLIGIAYSDTAIRDQEMRIRTYVSRKYYQALQKFDADVILLPPSTDDTTLKRYIELVDGILFAGGEDIDPRFMSQDPHPKLGLVNPYRDEYELKLAKLAYNYKKPTLGICRGLQVMVVALGGTLHQDIPSLNNTILHDQKAPRWATSHKVILNQNSILYKWFQVSTLFVNSFHHQAANKLPTLLTASAYAPDNIIEAIEAQDKNQLYIAVQWHPEETLCTDEYSKQIFANFIEYCKAYT